MTYYDIHTHQPARRPEDVAIISVNVCDPHNPIEASANRILSDSSSGSTGTDCFTEYYSVGIHPWDPDKKQMKKVFEYASLPSVVAIGETGLDKVTAKNTLDLDRQRELFTAHIHLSEEIGKPLIIHCVKAWDELLHIRKTEKPAMPWIIHGFGGKEALAVQLLNAGLYLSFGIRRSHINALKVAWESHHLLAETDNLNTDIRDVYKHIAKQLGITVHELSKEIFDFLTTFLPPI
ncbi:MAG: TatD family hydrolase [Tannerella sp.]|jgi:TatD DNase family protein|nr:TatD family hydrolase [Tannerella sp.]